MSDTDIDKLPDDERYANHLCQLLGLADTRDVFVIAGRGTAKTSAVLAQRSMRVINSLPRHNMAWACATYASFYANVLPALLEGWNREGWTEGVHYIVNKKPPAHFKKPYRPVKSYKNTICIANGVVIYIVSQVRLEAAAGNSYVHLFVDECRLIDHERLERLLPAIRGMERGTESPYFLGHTYASDRPNENTGDHTWLLDTRRNMDPAVIRQILSEALLRNALLSAEPETEADASILSAVIAETTVRLNNMRATASLFVSVTSFVNASVLGSRYFESLFSLLTDEDIRVSVLSQAPTSGSLRAFYPSFRMDRHTFSDGEKDDIELPADMRDFAPTADTLRYYDPDAPLEMSMDFGTNMTSLIVSQSSADGSTIRFLKNFYALRPDGIPELVDRVLSFFATHRRRFIYYYYDRAGNQHKGGSVLSDAEFFRQRVQEHLVYRGWLVLPQSEQMPTIYQFQEFYIADAIFTGRIEGLPRVLIDRIHCRELISSIRMAEVIEKTDERGRKIQHKDKKSEKNFKSVEELPEKSTNLSDAFKYRICTRKNLSMLPASKDSSFFSFSRVEMPSEPK